MHSFLAQITFENKVSSLLKESFSNHETSKIFLALFFVGFLMNLTPCVYPLIPVTLGFFNRQTSNNFFQQLKLSFAYLVGIAVSYGIIGSLAALFGVAFGVFFSKPWFSIGLGSFLFLLGLSMFDLYTIRLPQFVHRFVILRNGILGAFTMGLIIGISAAPCTGPLLATAFVELVNLKNPSFCIISFIVIGLGLGLPYFILGCFSKNLKALPESGNWLNWVKAILGIYVLSVGLNYIVMGLPKEIQANYKNFLWIGFYVLCIFLLVKIQSKTHRMQHMLYAATFAFLGWLLKSSYNVQTPALNQTKKTSTPYFIPFTTESYEKAKRSGKPTLIYVTADWCGICGQVQKNLFDKGSVNTLLQNVELLKIDWSTGVDDKYISYTQDLFGVPGIPFFIFLKPNGHISHTAIGSISIDDLKTNLLKADSSLGVN